MSYKFRGQKRLRGKWDSDGKAQGLGPPGKPTMVLMTAGAFAELPPPILTRSSMFQLLDGPVRISQ